MHNAPSFLPAHFAAVPALAVRLIAVAGPVAAEFADAGRAAVAGDLAVP